MSRRRLEAPAGMNVLQVHAAVREVARRILVEQVLPPAATSDALHVAAASFHGVDHLLTWNCRHLANPHLLKRLRACMARQGLALPEICTPIELGGH